MPPQIDGKANELFWKDIPVATGFLQDEPNYGSNETELTEVKIAYDNSAIYVAAMMYDHHPDSICHELGDRDNVDELNADAFGIGFDTYNKQADAYVFYVSASGVQWDFRWQYVYQFEKLIKVTAAGSTPVITLVPANKTPFD